MRIEMSLRMKMWRDKMSFLGSLSLLPLNSSINLCGWSELLLWVVCSGIPSATCILQAQENTSVQPVEADEGEFRNNNIRVIARAQQMTLIS